MRHGQAAAEAGVARRGRVLPAPFACWDAGEIGFAHLKAVRAGLRLLPASLWAEVDQPLATAARGRTPKELAGHLREWAQALQPAGQSREEIQREARRLSVAVGF